MNKTSTLRLHLIIVTLLSLTTLAGFFTFFFVLSGGSFGPLFRKANQLDFDFLVIRRVTSLLSWMVFSTLAIYFGSTEIFPRLERGSKTRKSVKIINKLIIVNYLIATLYAFYQFSVVFFENELQMRVIRLLYLSDLGIALFGLIIYLMLLFWVPKVVERKYGKR